jgi:hypothetical protein
LGPQSVPTAVEAFSLSTREVVGTKRDKHTVWGYNRYAATFEPLKIEVVRILEGHGRYGETPASHLLEKDIQVKRVFDPGYTRAVAAAGGLLQEWKGVGKWC